jgi:concentrative nucleoside transporter, CNT family
MHPQGLLGVALILAVGYLLCPTRRAIERRVILAGVALQFAVAFLALSFPPVVAVIDGFAGVVTKVISFADEGTRFLFGSLADPAAGPWGFVFVVRVMPVIVFFAALMGVLYHLGVMQRVVGALAWLLRKTMKITGTEALCAATNVFVGQTEAPLTIKPYLRGMTRSQLMAVMTGGFATIAGSVLAAYVGILGGDDPESQRLFAKHLLTASVMSAPAGLVMAKLMLPETESPPSESLRDLVTARPTTRNVIDAASEGATDGLKLALNVAAMLVAFVSLLALVNYPLAAISRWEPIAAWRAGMGIPELSFQNILGVIFTPLAWAMGVAWTDARAFGSMLGTQVILTEFVAYLDLGKHLQNGTLSPRSAQIATYALCGFANVASIAIQIGGLSAIAPERRADFVALAPRAMLAGALACWMTGAVASVFIP